MKIIVFIVLSFITLLEAGCSTISYKPEVALDLSPKTIQTSVQIDGFDDLSPDKDRELIFLGWSATNPRSLAGKLAGEVTDAVLNDFKNNSLFKNVERRLINADFVIKGKIHRFYGKAGAILWTIPVDVLWFIGLPCESVESGVDMEIFVYSPKGDLVGAYKGKSETSEFNTIYNSRQSGVGSVVNRNFSEALQQIRTAILNDEEKILKYSSNSTEILNTSAIK